MWVFMSESFLSIVAHRDQPDMLLVRSRVAGDIERVFPAAAVAETPRADYRFRALVSRAEVADRIAEQARKIRYPNFKDSVDDDVRHEAYMDVWHAMFNLQSIKRRDEAKADRIAGSIGY